MKFLRRMLRPATWKDLRTTQPLSQVFGFDRGTPVDRYYIEKFLSENSACIQGDVLEIAESTYTHKFGSNVRAHIFDYSSENSKASVIGDLTDHSTLPEGYADCFICTQTFNFIYDIKKAIEGARILLKENGVLLVTLAGISQISRYDMDRWGDYWRFTTASAKIAFEDVFGIENIEVKCFGNVLSSIALLHGISVEELSTDELEHKDENYQVTITVKARKR